MLENVNIININYMLEQEYKKHLIFDDEDNYQNRDEVKNYAFYECSKYLYDYDYDEEFRYLSGKEKNECLKYMTDYIKQYLNDQYNYKNFKSFFIINESYAYLYIENNYENWFNTRLEEEEYNF